MARFTGLARVAVCSLSLAGLSACTGSGGKTSQLDGGPVSGCWPIQGTKNILQSSLPAGDAYGELVSDGQSVYFAGTSAVYRLPVSGGAAQVLYSGPLGVQLAAAAGTVAWVPYMPDNVTPAGLTVENAAGVHDVAFPDGVRPTAAAAILVGADGSAYFEVDISTDSRSHTWTWNPATDVAGEMPGVGMPATGAGTNLYWVDRGQIFWANNVGGPAGGMYATDLSTGAPRQIADDSTTDFGGLAGVDAENLYGFASNCVDSACPFTVYGTSRAGGGTPFVAYQSPTAYWTASPPQIDDAGLYWIDWSTRGIYHAAITLGAPAELAAQLLAPGAAGTVPATFAMDACNLYWLTTDATGAPAVMATAK
jgi:hypothetical protein